MREEWETETGIKVLEGWSFQVNEVVIFFTGSDSLATPVLFGVSPCFCPFPQTV